MAPSTNQSTWKDMVDQFKANNYIDKGTRAVIVAFSFYNPSHDEWMAVDILIEFSVTGLVNPSFL